MGSSRTLIYVAGPLFDPGERWYLEQVDAVCRAAGYDTYLPHRDGGLKAGPHTDFGAIFVADLAALERGAGGGRVERPRRRLGGRRGRSGFVYACGVPVIGLHEDIRINDPTRQVNIVVSQSANMICGSLGELEAALLARR